MEASSVIIPIKNDTVDPNDIDPSSSSNTQEDTTTNPSTTYNENNQKENIIPNQVSNEEARLYLNSFSHELSTRQSIVVESIPKISSPFFYDGNGISFYEIFKICLGVIIVPIRVLLVLITFVSANFLLWLAIYFPTEDIEKPPGMIGNALIRCTNFHGRLVLFICGFYTIKFKGKIAKTSKARLCVLAPHSTIADSVLSSYCATVPSGVAKAHLKNYPLAGTLVKANRFILVDRESKDAKALVLEKIKERVGENSKYRRLIVFPEGTCTNRSKLIEFKHGSFNGSHSVQPILLRYPFKYFNPTWTSGGPSRLLLTFRLLCQFRNYVTVEYLPVYTPSAEEAQDSKLYATNVQNLMATELGIETSAHSYSDSFLAGVVHKSKLSVRQTLDFVVSDLKKHFPKLDTKLTLKRAKDFAYGYHHLEKENDKENKNDEVGFCRLNQEQFHRAIGHIGTSSGDPVSSSLWSFIKSSKHESISLKEFFVGLNIMESSPKYHESINWIYAFLLEKNTSKGVVNISHRVSEIQFSLFLKKHGIEIPREEKDENRKDMDAIAFAERLKPFPQTVYLLLEAITKTK